MDNNNNINNNENNIEPQASGVNATGNVSDNIYHYTREQLEHQWQPNTGTYSYGAFQDSKEAEKSAKKAKKAAKKQAKQNRKAGKKPITGAKVALACTASALAAVIASSAVMYGLYKGSIEENYVSRDEYKSSQIQSTGTKLNSTQLTVSDGEDENVYSVSQVADAVLPSVVAITSTAMVNSNYNPFFGGGSYQVKGAGSGIIVGKSDTELLIVTNNHVVEDTTSLSVEFNNGTAVDTAYVKGTDSSNDVAVVAIKISDLDDDTISAIKIAVLGDSDDLKVGEGVVAIGNALGYGISVTSGVLSAIDRTITLDYGELNVIQTDASINGGNSGGALVNRQGEVIGINVAKASNSSSSSASVEGMGYAIPITQVKDIISDLMNKETKLPVEEDERGYIGITSSTYVEVDENTSSMYNIPEGIYLREINEGTPLDEAGIAVGDVITKVDGEKVRTFDELKTEISYFAAGDTVTLTVQVRGERSYKEKNIDVKLVSLDELNKIIK